jgi:ribosomal protein S6
LPFRIRSKYLPEGERYQKTARYVSLYYDAPVSARNDLEISVRLDEKVLRFNTLKLPSVVDEVEFILISLVLGF